MLFGKEDVLINNIAWALRHLPIFGVFDRIDFTNLLIANSDAIRTAKKPAQGLAWNEHSMGIGSGGPEHADAPWTERPLSRRGRPAIRPSPGRENRGLSSAD